MTADFIRLRAPVPDETKEMLKNRPRLLYGAQLAQPALLPPHALPLAVGFWSATVPTVREAGLLAMGRWNEEMARHTSIPVTFVPWQIGDDFEMDLMLGDKFFPWSAAGFTSPGDRKHGFGRDGSVDEMGECTLYWDEDHRIIVGKAYCPTDAAKPDAAGALAHELGHGLLLGHERHLLGHLMYPKHGGVMKPRKAECKWVEEIWTP